MFRLPLLLLLGRAHAGTLSNDQISLVKQRLAQGAQQRFV
jgi:hypothetical protein